MKLGLSQPAAAAVVVALAADAVPVAAAAVAGAVAAVAAGADPVGKVLTAGAVKGDRPETGRLQPGPFRIQIFSVALSAR